ncbi:MAG: YbaB/EbfC family nucleoid-associated protein [Armatimonadota bacterium]|nr:YbaB/EbfC family nucleoid-associated protein [Armatimonadota bacterium]MDR5697393.1 YbaB/EbfC family nucleoid-associated protein [Armatimonadota bacterium]
MMNMGKMLKQVQKMQAEIARIQEQLSAERVEGTAGGGAVRIVANGHGELLEVRIAREAVDPDDVEMLQDLVLAAVNEAHNRAKELAAARMQSVTGGLPLAGMMG